MQNAKNQIRTRRQGDTPFFPNMLNNGKVEVCLKEDVDATIAELKDEINRKEGVEKRWFAQCMEARTENVRLKRALWKLKALYFYRMFQWSMEGKRLAPEDDEPEDFFMECLGKHTKRKSEWGKEADMFDNARIVCIKKSEEYNV